MDVSLVIPAHNEQENLRPLVVACGEVLDRERGEHEIVFVQDGSTDDSDRVLAELGVDEPRLRVIRHAPGANVGCHPSELEGLRAARGDAAVFLPADLQIRPDVVLAFLDAVREGADIVASWRRQRADAAWRRWLSAANNRVERTLIGVDVHDAHSSMAFSRRAMDDVVPGVRSDSALIPAEMLLLGKHGGLRIDEIEIPHFPRAAGRQTGAKPSEVLRVQLDLVKLRSRLHRA